MNIPIVFTKQQWQLVVRTLRGGPKRTDAEQLDTLIKHIEDSVSAHRGTTAK